MKIRFKDLKKMRNYINIQTKQHIDNKDFRNWLKYMSDKARYWNTNHYWWNNHDTLYGEILTINNERFEIHMNMDIVRERNHFIYFLDLDYAYPILSFKEIAEWEESINEFTC